MPCAYGPSCEEPLKLRDDGTTYSMCETHVAAHAARDAKSRAKLGPALRSSYVQAPIDDLIRDLQREDLDLG